MVGEPTRGQGAARNGCRGSQCRLKEMKLKEALVLQASRGLGARERRRTEALTGNESKTMTGTGRLLRRRSVSTRIRCVRAARAGGVDPVTVKAMSMQHGCEPALHCHRSDALSHPRKDAEQTSNPRFVAIITACSRSGCPTFFSRSGSPTRPT